MYANSKRIHRKIIRILWHRNVLYAGQKLYLSICDVVQLPAQCKQNLPNLMPSTQDLSESNLQGNYTEHYFVGQFWRVMPKSLFLVAATGMLYVLDAKKARRTRETGEKSSYPLDSSNLRSTGLSDSVSVRYECNFNLVGKLWKESY